MGGGDGERGRLGAWYTPAPLVERVVAGVVDAEFVARRGMRGPLRIVDPACGDGRFLLAARDAVRALGADATLLGVDVDAGAVRAAGASGDVEVIHADALTCPRLFAEAGRVDLVVGNPPFLSPLSASRPRGPRRLGGGPYADAAADFLSLGSELVDPDGGRLALVLPQSVLSARDAGAVRRRIDDRATMVWSAWTGEWEFADAQVVTCALAFEFSPSPAATGERSPGGPDATWSHVVTERLGVPPIPAALDGAHAPAGRLGDRARLNANFRDEYYGMIPGVGDHASGPPLVTSGLIDPLISRWGRREVRFAKRGFAAPRLDLDALDPAMRAWAERRLVPKVLVANQTAIVEAVCDPHGEWLPAVPVVAAYPGDVDVAWEIAAVLTSPAVSAWAWHRRAGTGLSATTIRVGPTLLAEVPWPTGDLSGAVAAARRGDALACAVEVDAAYGLDVDEHAAAMAWWSAHLERITSRAP